MNEILNRNVFFVKEHVGMFKAANNFDILDPQSQGIILECREEHLSLLTKIFRFTDYKRMTPFDIEVKTPEGQVLLRIKRGVSIFLSNVTVYDGNGTKLGGFKQKFLSIGGAFTVLNEGDQPICELKGKWTGWNFSFMRNGVELAHVSKEWAGMAKELFTSADNYVLSISDTVSASDPVRALILAAVLCIDMVLKE